MDLIDLLLAAGPVVVAGLGLAVVDRVLGDAAPAPVVLARRIQPLGAAAALASLVLDSGGVAGLLAATWLAVCLCVSAGGAVLVARLATGDRATRRGAPPPLPTATLAVGLGYLTVGGAWLVISRLDLHPFDLSDDVVRLTAVHFHYAGFGLPLLAASGLAAVDYFASRVALVLGCLAAMVGPPVVAAGIATHSAAAEVLGALVMTAAAWAVAFGTFLLATSSSALVSRWPMHGRSLGARIGRTLLVVSSLSPVVPMVLAVQWALAQHTGLPALSIDDMASTHGVLNGIGFIIVGLAGWYLGTPRATGSGEPSGGGRAVASAG